MDRETFLALLTKKLSGELSAVEQAQLDGAVETSKEYQLIHESILQHSYNSGLQLNPEKQLAILWKKTESVSVAAKIGKRMPYRYIWLVAAGIIFLVGIFCCWLLFQGNPGPDDRDMITLITQHQKLDTTLKDGSRIVLRENSRLAFSSDFGAQKRKIILYGNAFFDVAKNSRVPMIIQSGPINITVKGTSFFVDSINPKNMEVKLLRGIVEVSNRLDANNKVLLKPVQKLSVAKNADRSLQFAIIKLPEKDTSMPVVKQDTLVFNNERLDILVLRLEKKYKTKIEIRNEALNDKKFSGMFTKETLTEALEALRYSYPFTFRADGKTIIIE